MTMHMELLVSDLSGQTIDMCVIISDSFWISQMTSFAMSRSPTWWSLEAVAACKAKPVNLDRGHWRGRLLILKQQVWRLLSQLAGLVMCQSRMDVEGAGLCWPLDRSMLSSLRTRIIWQLGGLLPDPPRPGDAGILGHGELRELESLQGPGREVVVMTLSAGSRHNLSATQHKHRDLSLVRTGFLLVEIQRKDRAWI